MAFAGTEAVLSITGPPSPIRSPTLRVGPCRQQDDSDHARRRPATNRRSRSRIRWPRPAPSAARAAASRSSPRRMNTTTAPSHSARPPSAATVAGTAGPGRTASRCRCQASRCQRGPRAPPPDPRCGRRVAPAARSTASQPVGVRRVERPRPQQRRRARPPAPPARPAVARRRGRVRHRLQAVQRPAHEGAARQVHARRVQVVTDGGGPVLGPAACGRLPRPQRRPRVVQHPPGPPPAPAPPPAATAPARGGPAASGCVADWLRTAPRRAAAPAPATAAPHATASRRIG